MRTLLWRPWASAAELLAPPVRAALTSWGSAAATVAVSPVDPALSDTAAFCAAYGVSPDRSANCVVVAGRRDGRLRHAACVVLASDRADVNGAVRRLLDVRKASFLPTDDAVAVTGMASGGITPIGLPPDWPVFVATEVAAAGDVVLGAGVRGAKIRISGAVLAGHPGARVVTDLVRR